MSETTYREVITDQVNLICNTANVPFTEFLTSIANLIITLQIHKENDIKSIDDFKEALKKTSAYDICAGISDCSIVEYIGHVMNFGKFLNWLLDQQAPFFDDDNDEKIWYAYETIAEKYNEYVAGIKENET